MNYMQARNYIDELSAAGGRPGLAAITQLLKLLGDPQDTLRYVHVAGTNGKGSVLAYLSSVLQEAGYTVGRYISPTLFSYRERIQIDGAYISREDFARLLSMTAEARAQMETEGLPLPTAFEMETAVSFLYFKEKHCDLVLLEAGMGGLLDATNVIRTPVVTALASVSMDHMEFLGNTIEEIALQKAGIFKAGIPAVSAVQQTAAARVICEEAEKKGCECTFVDLKKLSDVRYGLDRQQFSYGSFSNVEIRLAGLHQIENAALALECVEALRRAGYRISEDAAVRGMQRTEWKGRFSVIHREPVVILDGAHNPDAAQRLCASVKKYFPNQKKYYIFGVFSDKEYDKIIDSTAELAEHIITIQTPGNPRALPAQELAQAVRRKNPSVEAAGSIEEAVDKCLRMAEKDDVILVFGSLSFLADVEQKVMKWRRI